ncbi:transcription termination/antitermination protein NusA [Mycoplasma sp. NEAQ87857]|uniref:NusA N-terminal domain-containing protein n=1 Tax=Mycoplasma sp. NEAQ87857 TaxID=2683967 RepID=UPI001317E9AA|nr:NusA N-terminal domain-containing protein [Mycoplasma sp. NEAQ87857]QGZ97891.1 transcription termination/antitermination protein NusA [Mycoplasma sp. NEAQ87857]
MSKVTKNNKTLINEQKMWFQIITGYAKEYDLPYEEVLAIFEEELAKAINRDIDPDAEIKIISDIDQQSVLILNSRCEIVDNDFEFHDGEEQEVDIQRISYITEDDARMLKADTYEEDGIVYISKPIDFDVLPGKTKIAIKNGFIQSLKLAQKQRIIEKYSNRIGQKIRAQVLNKNSKGSYNLQFEDGVTAYLPSNKVNKKLDIKLGGIIDVYLESINPDSKLSICEVSTDSPQEIFDVMHNEIPEIANGDIEIVKIQRIPGVRAKIAIQSNPKKEFDYDVVGSIFGEGAKRILAISDKLKGEKVDIIRYSEDMLEYVKNALSPAKVLDVVTQGRKYIAIVKPNDIMVAIGKQGINIELASKLLAVKLEILTTEEATEKDFEFKERYLYEKPMFHTAKANHRHSKVNKYFKGLEIDLSEFSNDVANFIANSEKEELELSEQTATKRNSRKKAKDKTINSSDLDNLFSEENLNIQLEENEDEYDFVDEIDKIFDEEFIAEDEVETKEENEVKAKPKKAVQAYKKSKIELNDFKMDNDLANYGLSSNLDLNDFDDEWEDE